MPWCKKSIFLRSWFVSPVHTLSHCSACNDLHILCIHMLYIYHIWLFSSFFVNKSHLWGLHVHSDFWFSWKGEELLETVSLCSPGFPWTHHPSVSVSWVLGLQTDITTPTFMFFLNGVLMIRSSLFWLTQFINLFSMGSVFYVLFSNLYL